LTARKKCANTEKIGARRVATFAILPTALILSAVAVAETQLAIAPPAYAQGSTLTADEGGGERPIGSAPDDGSDSCIGADLCYTGNDPGGGNENGNQTGNNNDSVSET
jgi:hypothetical protein